MKMIRLTPEDLEEMKIQDFEKFKNSVNDFRKANDLDPLEFEPTSTKLDTVSDSVKDFIRTNYGNEATEQHPEPNKTTTETSITKSDIENFINQKYI